MIMKAALSRVCACLAAVSMAAAQQPSAVPANANQSQAPAIELSGSSGGVFSGFTRPYTAPHEAEVNFSNSGRLEALLRAGNLYLSLQDAIALALENNLDIESQRYERRIAEADILRAEAGTLLRGTSSNVSRGPSSASGILGAANLLGGGGTGGGSTAGGTFGGLSIQQIGTSIPNLDPVVTANIGWNHQTNPLSTRFISGTSSNYLISESDTANFGISKSFLTGTSVRFNFENQGISQNSPNNNINPSRTGNASLTISQPLLQGFGIALNNRNIRVAKNNIKITDLTFKSQVIATVSSVIRLYWDLVSFREDAKVKRQALSLAEKLYNDNKKQVEIGTLAPIEIVRAEAEVAARQADLTNSESQVTQQETILKNYLSKNGVASPSISDANVIPTDRIEVPAADAVQPVQDMISMALQQRPEVEQAQINIANSQITMKGVKNALLPQLSVYATAQNNALAGQINTIPYPTEDGLVAAPRAVDPFFLGGYSTVLSQLFRRSFPDYGVGFQLNIPLRNRSAQGNLIQSQLQLRQQQISQRKMENQVRVDVKNAVVALQQARARYESAQKARVLQEQTLDAEQKKYTLGASTIYFVIQAQRDLAQAQSTEVSALSDYAKARSSLDDALGRTLEVNNVSIEEAFRGQVSRPPAPLPALQQ